MMITIRVLAAISALAFASGVGAAQWKQVGKAAGVELWIDTASVKRSNGEVAFEYRIDNAKALTVVDGKGVYRSTITKAKVRCNQRSISIGPSVAYAGAKGTGNVVARIPPTPDEARFQPVERDSSDESLWQQVCRIAQLTPQK